MRIIVDVPEYLVERARKLIGQGTYRDLSSFVTASMESQLTLEERESAEQVLTLAREQERVARVSARGLPLAADLSIPQGERPTLGYPTRPGDTLAEQWPWGQINKILPVKFTVRLLANEVSEVEPLVPLDVFRMEAARKAKEFGRWLAKNDAKYKRRWGERLSAGFPIGKDEESSLNRYASHFVGHERKRDGALFGALFDLKFGNAEVVGRALSVGLTEAGLEFARISNPVLDDSDLSSSLSEEEIEFYLEHIRARVPGEVYAFELILSLIAEGVNGREELNEQIKKRVPLDWTDAVVNTQRAGAMARMYELGLIEKSREGLRVEYGVSERGIRWLRVSK